MSSHSCANIIHRQYVCLMNDPIISLFATNKQKITSVTLRKRFHYV
ncbi:hypothetical protein THIARS_60149 [Thiomonas delicata]|uniref:Uncharacterized protein n=1 Tax=Thiomonas delicata TaxID=364030 RepID=A0A238D2E2_THIDL|nr:hypothetical protein THIARS_60149 [Thiomonas delicata]